MEEPVTFRIAIPPIEGVEDVPIAAVQVLASKMGFSEDRVQDIVQALTEACVNSILYSVSDADIEIMATAEPKSLMVEVSDRGPGFDPESVQSPDFETMTEIGVKSGGFGIHMIKALVDKVEIESSPEGTTVRMYAFL
ncbi:MAG: ATP-binding protein [Oscillatoriales cyanobacterium SM2_1_8]|nr:ATP-binding protein [Oscillatoriales cyanobacterium SM2_1_8]